MPENNFIKDDYLIEIVVFFFILCYDIILFILKGRFKMEIKDEIEWSRNYAKRRAPYRKEWKDFYNFLKQNNFKKNIFGKWHHKEYNLTFYRGFFIKSGYNYLVKKDDFELFDDNIGFNIEKWKHKILDTLIFLQNENIVNK